MTLAELIDSSSKSRAVMSTAFRERLEHLRRTNCLVDDVCFGRTTFSKVFEASYRPWRRFLPFLPKSEDARNLDYLLASSAMPADYYVKEIDCMPPETHWSSRVSKGLIIAYRYSADPLLNGILASLMLLPFSRDASVYSGTAVSSARLSYVAFSDFRGWLGSGEAARKTAKLLDNLVQAAYAPAQSASGEREPAAVRRRSAIQHMRTAEAHLHQKRHDEAAAELEQAVKLNPLDIAPRYQLIACHMRSGMVESCFAELREARVLFGESMDNLDIRVSLIYANHLDEQGKREMAGLVRNSAIMRTGFSAVRKVMNDLKENRTVGKTAAYTD